MKYGFSFNLNSGRVVHRVEGPIFVFEQVLVDYTALYLMLFIVRESEWIDPTFLCFQYRLNMLLFGHSNVVMSGSNFFPESFFWFGVSFSNYEEKAIWLFIGEEKIFNEGTFLKFQFLSHFLHIKNRLMFV